MSESENHRTTINVTKDSHGSASDTKEEYDETWDDVLDFYTEFREEVTRALNIPEDLEADE